MLTLGPAAGRGSMSRLTIRAKTFTASVVVLTCVIGMGAAVLLTSRQVTQNLSALSRSNLPTRAAAEAVSDAVIAAHMRVFRYVSWASNGVNDKLLQELRHTIDTQFLLIDEKCNVLATRPDLSRLRKAISTRSGPNCESTKAQLRMCSTSAAPMRQWRR